jgi:hypothetical protein
LLRRFGPITLAIIGVKGVSRIGVDDDLDIGVMRFKQCLEFTDILRCRVLIFLSKQAEEGAGDVFCHIEAADRPRVILILSPRRAIPGDGSAEIFVIGCILDGCAAALAKTSDPDPFGLCR